MTGPPLSNFLTAQSVTSRGSIDAILSAVRHHLGMEIAFASRFVDEQREFTHLSSDLPLPSAPGDREPLEDGYCWHIQQGRLPELIPHAQDLQVAHGIAITGALPVGCHISVPLRLKDGSVYGSFCCLSRTPDYSLTDRDLATVKAFADLASAQIELETSRGAEERSVLERVHGAIDAEQPAIHLQPIHRLDNSRTVGAEALARFPDAGVRPPSNWFEEADRVGLGVALEVAAVRQALRTLPHVPADHYLSVNVSPATVLGGALEPLLAETSGRKLVVEVTEHTRVEDYAALRTALARLRPYARLAIDDVGAGYAGLRHIISLEPDILKLDISLTGDIDRDPAKRALAVALVSFAGRIGSVIVAEGIEREEERKVLHDLGIAFGQGWLFSRAMPVVAAQQFLLGCDRRSAPAAAASPFWSLRSSANG